MWILWIPWACSSLRTKDALQFSQSMLLWHCPLPPAHALLGNTTAFAWGPVQVVVGQETELLRKTKQSKRKTAATREGKKAQGRSWIAVVLGALTLQHCNSAWLLSPQWKGKPAPLNHRPSASLSTWCASEKKGNPSVLPEELYERQKRTTNASGVRVGTPWKQRQYQWFGTGKLHQ